MIDFKSTANYAGMTITVELRESLNQEGLSRPGLVKLDGRMTAGKKSVYFPFQCRRDYFAAHSNPPAVSDVLETLIMDVSAYEECGEDIDVFAREFGDRGSISKTIAAFERCRQSADALHQLFTKNQMKELWELCDKGWTQEAEREIL